MQIRNARSKANIFRLLGWKESALLYKRITLTQHGTTRLQEQLREEVYKLLRNFKEPIVCLLICGLPTISICRTAKDKEGTRHCVLEALNPMHAYEILGLQPVGSGRKIKGNKRD